MARSDDPSHQKPRELGKAWRRPSFLLAAATLASTLLTALAFIGWLQR